MVKYWYYYLRRFLRLWPHSGKHILFFHYMGQCQSVAWRDLQFPPFTMINAAASTRTTSTKTTAKATTSTKKSTATTKSSTKKKKKGGISSGGSIAGLVIGIIVIVAVLLIAGLKNKAKKNVEGGEMEREGGQDPPKEGHYAGEGGNDREISGDTPREHMFRRWMFRLTSNITRLQQDTRWEDQDNIQGMSKLGSCLRMMVIWQHHSQG